MFTVKQDITAVYIGDDILKTPAFKSGFQIGHFYYDAFLAPFQAL